MAASAEAAALTERHRIAQAALRTDTVIRMQQLGRLLDPTDLAGTTGPWLDASVRLVTVQRERSAALSRAYFRAFRLLELGEAWDGPLPEAPVPIDALRTSLLVTGPVQARTDTAAGMSLAQVAFRMIDASSAAASRHVLNGGRDTIIGAVLDDERSLGWIRVTDGDPCAFCAMLASRGPVYRSHATSDFQAHDRCACTAEPMYRDDAAWPGRSNEFRALWNESTAGHSGRAAINAFRRAYERG